MKSFSVFYLRNPGFGNSWKCGISSGESLWSRLGVYQNAFGPDYKENWKHIWVGNTKQIRLLEEKYKEQFDDKIIGGDAGYSEWITNTSESELLDAVRFFKDEYFIKVIDVPEHLKPFTTEKINDLKAWVASLSEMG